MKKGRELDEEEHEEEIANKSDERLIIPQENIQGKAKGLV